jgi:hypothetical protein
MRLEHRRSVLLLLLLACALALSSGAFAQGGATSVLAGKVIDSSGAVLPGADVTARNVATGTTFTAVSGPDGGFTIPAIPSGTYAVTVSLMGFKTVVLNNVTATVGNTASVKATLEIGAFEETVQVEAAAQMVQTQQTSVSSTINVKQISSLPLAGRSAFEFVTQMPGVASTDGSSRGATVNGLPQSVVNITLDGMNIQDNYAKSWDGMYTRVSPRLDAVEELQVGSAAQGADASQGGVQVRFVTRSGTNQWRGSAYYYLRHDALNSNTWFNTHRDVDASGNPTEKPTIRQYQPGVRLGGPILKDKAFFFVNYEWLDAPGTNTATRTIMSPSSEQGIFLYNGGASSVNLLALAASKGQTATVDPLVAKTLAAIRGSVGQGTLNASTDPQTQSLTWQQPTSTTTTYPTFRVDYNLSARHRLTASYTRNHYVADPDTGNLYQARFPGSKVYGTQDSERYSGQGALRSMLTSNLVNEVRFGATGGSTDFAPNASASMFEDSGGYALGITSFKSITNPYPLSANASREATTKVIEDTVNWMKGKHTLNFGGSFTQAEVWLANQQLAPTISFGVVTGDPADALFTATNFPGASSTDLTNARNLYAVLTGRVSSIGREARIGASGDQYSVLGSSMQKGRMREFGFFLQDSWRVRPNLTVNLGLRYELQLPFYALNNSYSMATMDDIMGVTGTGSDFVPGSTVNNIGNLFKPGTLEGGKTTYKLLGAGTHAYNVDKNNLAPNIGVAWTVGSDQGFLRRLLGRPGDSVLRAGYSISYQRSGMSDFALLFGANPGIAIDATRNQTNGNLGALPLLLSGGDLSAPAINLSRTYPMSVPSVSSSVYAFDPNIQVPSSRSFTVGMQRALSKTMLLEARFVHTSSQGIWTNNSLWGYLDYNEVNIVENGFLDEFRKAQSNLQANIAAGRGNTFAYTGAAGTQPLPALLGFFNGASSSWASSPGKYTGSYWTNSTLVSYLYPLNPLPVTMANAMRNTAAIRANGVAAGLPANYFVANPDVTNAYVTTNGPDTRYNGVQLTLTRRYSQGIQASANYSYGRGYQTYFYSFRKPMVEQEQNLTNSGSSNATGNARHIFTANWVYELPFGQGKPFASGVGKTMQRLVGNWSWSGTARVQSGRMVDLGNVRLVGMTKDELSDAFELRKAGDASNAHRTLVYMLPQDIIDNTIRAFSVTATGYSSLGAPSGRYLAPANGQTCVETAVRVLAREGVTGYGDCGTGTLQVTGPKVVRFDMSVIKEVPVTGRVSLRFEAMVFNVFNNVNFNPVTPNTNPNVSGGFAASDNYQVTAAVDQSRAMQLAFRVNW